MRPIISDLHDRGFVGLAAPWLAVAIGITLEAFSLIVGVAPAFVLIHFVLNPLAYFAACVVSLFLYRPWRANGATAFLLLGFALCGVLIYHSITGQVWPYTHIKPNW